MDIIKNKILHSVQNDKQVYLRDIQEDKRICHREERSEEAILYSKRGLDSLLRSHRDAPVKYTGLKYTLFRDPQGMLHFVPRSE